MGTGKLMWIVRTRARIGGRWRGSQGNFSCVKRCARNATPSPPSSRLLYFEAFLIQCDMFAARLKAK